PSHEHLHAKHLAPREHSGDQSYPSGPQFVRQGRLGTKILGLVGQDTSWQQREQTGYALEDFTLDWPGQVATCPQGQTRVSWTQPPDGQPPQAVVVRFATATCRSCAVRAQCTRGQRGRTLTLTPPEVHAALLERR